MVTKVSSDMSRGDYGKYINRVYSDTSRGSTRGIEVEEIDI